jgi:transposase
MDGHWSLPSPLFQSRRPRGAQPAWPRSPTDLIRLDTSLQKAGPRVENLPDVAVLVEPLLVVRRVLREQVGILHRRLLAIVRDDDVCRGLMTVPGVGPVVALTYRATVDVPARFRNSKAVGAVFGLTPSWYQSGESDRIGKISRCGDEMTRMMLYEAAQSMLVRSAKWSWLKAWAMKIARHRGRNKAIVALARRLAVIMHRIWVDGTEFRWTREVAAA